MVLRWPSARLFALVCVRSQNGKMDISDIRNGDLRQARRRRTNGIYDVNRERTAQCFSGQAVTAPNSLGKSDYQDRKQQKSAS